MWKKIVAWLPLLIRLLASWFEKQPRDDYYTPAERNIYRYYNGQSEVAADPMVLYKRLSRVGKALAIDLKVANAPVKDATLAHERAMQSIREIFDLKPYAEGGLTETEALQLLDHFWFYCDSIKKKSSTGPISVTGTSPTSPPSSEGSPLTRNSSDSGSTEGDRTTETPTPPPSAPESPSGS